MNDVNKKQKQEFMFLGSNNGCINSNSNIRNVSHIITTFYHNFSLFHGVVVIMVSKLPWYGSYYGIEVTMVCYGSYHGVVVTMIW